MKSKDILRVLTGIVILVLLMVGSYLYFKKTSSEENKEGVTSSGSTSVSSSAPMSKKEEAPLPVRVIDAKYGDLIMRLKTVGEVVARRNVKMKSEIRGIVKKIYVAEGFNVKEGDLLLEFDDREYRLKLEETEATRLNRLSQFYIQNQYAVKETQMTEEERRKIEDNRKKFEEILSLFRNGKASEKQVEEAKREYEISLIEAGEKREDILAASTQLTQAEIEYKRAKIDLDRTKIISPFPGIITDIKVSEKENCETGRELFTIVDLDSVEIEAKILESEIGKVFPGREALMKFSAYPSKFFRGKVKSISPLVNPEDKTCKVFISIANPEERIKSGMHCEVFIDSEIYKERLIIPQEAVLVRGGRRLCFVVEGELAKWRYIDSGLENEEYVEVLNGVTAGEKVIVEGHFTLAHDSKVKIIK
ncbi:MAG: efflux RND transporter periplasmic adaptor subunit [Acidobacteriota bacterium]